MQKKNNLKTGEVNDNLENVVVSRYVKLCLDEGKKPSAAFRELKRNVRPAKELKTNK